MKGDISRQTFNSRKHYSKVVMQQGRVQLDADWNEQQDILLHRIETQTSEMIGHSGVSTNRNGFEVMFTPDGQDLVISPGSMYVDGVLCELEQEKGASVFSIDLGQVVLDLAEVDNQPFQKQHWAELIDNYGQELRLFKITDIMVNEDQETLTLFSEQLDFPTTNQNLDGYRVRAVTTYLTQPNYPNPRALPEPDKKKHGSVFLAYLDVWQRDITALDDSGIVEAALGGADTAQRSQTIWQVKIEPVDDVPEDLAEAMKGDTGKLSDEKRFELEQRMRRLFRIAAFRPPLSNLHMPVAPSTGRLSVRTTATSGYRGVENQLYHVEIHQDKPKDTTSIENFMPTFKWARNNASLFIAATIESGTVTAQGSGQGSLLGLVVGQYVELIDEQSELLGDPGHLAQIKQVNDITGQLTIDPAPPKNLKRVRLRLWNGTGSIDASENSNGSDDGWTPLEGGIELQFMLGETFHSGDYWLIPARTATRQIEWPHTAPQLPQGPQHHYVRLAYLLQTEKIWLAQDYRRHFFPLASNALHVLDINWKNDTLNSSSLLKEGLNIILDGEPDQECAAAMQAAMIVSVETALPGGGAGIFIISGHFEINSNVIRWHWHREEREGLIARFFARFDEFRSELFDRNEHLQRVRITVKGRYIFRTVNGRRIYLDGETFGMPGSEESGHMPAPPEHGKQPKRPGRHIDLQFPSGAGRPASDFESWFYMRE
jgi:Family of unknown function (DUF6519)